MNIDFSVPAPLKMQAFTILKNAIVNGVFKDNDAITERMVLEKFKISRTPFREAIQVLEKEGWVYTIPYKGIFVSPITLKDIQELFELRLLIEPSIIDNLFQKSKVEDCANKLEVIVNKMKTDVSIQSDFEFMLLDQEFHNLLYKQTENNRIIAVSEQISDTMLRVGIRVLHRKARREEVIEEHKTIIAGLRDGTAKIQLINHLNLTEESFIEMYKEASLRKLEGK
ncbi:GntR family transcriptional regulator [Bacillus sp. MM2020_1]|nr:GntR family transcriptional regulator [Bacillus sp. MM2020_1]